jgi:deoxyribonuclease-4
LPQEGGIKFMPWLGAHLSIAGGHYKAVEAARSHGNESLQIFTKNSNQWRAKPLAETDVKAFARAMRGSGLRRLLAHGSYLVNLATPDPFLYERSIQALIDESERAEQFSIHYLVTHPGAHVGSGPALGVERVAKAIDAIHRATRGFGVRILLENTAGQGSCLGSRPEELRQIIDRTAEPERLGVCFDTCHAFAAGFALWPRDAYEATWARWTQFISVNQIRAFHLNDSLRPMGSRLDRHAHIGRGCIGTGAFQLIVNDSRFKHRPMVIETPKHDHKDREMDSINLRLLRRLLANGQETKRKSVKDLGQS